MVHWVLETRNKTYFAWFVLLITTIFLYVDQSQHRNTIEKLKLDRVEMTDQKNFELNSLLLHLKTSIDRIKELEEEIDNYRVKLKEIELEKNYLTSQITIQKSNTEEMKLVLFTKEKRLRFICNPNQIFNLLI